MLNLIQHRTTADGANIAITLEDGVFRVTRVDASDTYITMDADTCYDAYALAHTLGMSL